MELDDAANALTSLSLVLATLAMVLSVWLPGALSVRGLEAKRYRASRNGQLEEIAAARTKLLLLASVSSIVASVFFVRSMRIISQAVTVGGEYHDISAALVVVEAILVAISIYTWSQTLKLHLKWRRFNRDEEIQPIS